MTNRRIIGIIILIAALVGIFYSGIIIIDDWESFNRNYHSAYQERIIGILVISIVVFIIGLIVTLAGKKKRKELQANSVNNPSQNYLQQFYPQQHPGYTGNSIPSIRCEKCGWTMPAGFSLPRFCPTCGNPFSQNQQQ